MIKVLVESTFTVFCDAAYVGTFAHEHDALNAGVEHIKKHHPKEYEKLNREARLAARSQNGAGYYDWDGDLQTQSGWVKARADFRQAWRRTALRYRTRN